MMFNFNIFSDLQIIKLRKTLNLSEPEFVKLDDYLAEILRERAKPEFSSISLEDIKNIPATDFEIRKLVETDDFYKKGMLGLFQKSTGKLLRRHTDLGVLTKMQWK